MDYEDSNPGVFMRQTYIPQDLQLIHDIIGDSIPPPPKVPSNENNGPDDDKDSSDNDSEKEVEDGILAGIEEDDGEGQNRSHPVSDDSDSSSSDSDSDDELAGTKPTPVEEDDNDIDDADGPNPTPANQLRTKNEIPEPEITITIPDIEEVGEGEEMEKVGEVMSVLNNNVALVKGLPSSVQNRAAERALDSETLLVFGDRKVLGYIYETFGPTHQPMYLVKFNSQYPLDPEKVKAEREVFHVPSRSKFVFVRQLRALKGSDASNAHDEEPAEDELEFSDDEEERAHKRSTERAREEARGGSSSSRAPPSIPSQMRDQDIAAVDMYGTYDAPYNDMDFGAGPSRPPPMPYDDPYSDQYGLESTSQPKSASSAPPVKLSEGDLQHQGNEGRLTAGGSRGRGLRWEERGRGRGRDRGGRGRGRGRGGSSGDDHSWGNRHSPQSHQSQLGYSPSEEYDPRQPRPMSPTSLAIARATGQYSDGSSYSSPYGQQLTQPQAPPQSPTQGGGGWGGYYYPPQQSFDFGYGYPPGYVQPHINPRFANQFGINFNMGYQQQPQQNAYGGEYGVSGGGTGGWKPQEDWSKDGSHGDSAGS